MTSYERIASSHLALAHAALLSASLAQRVSRSSEATRSTETANAHTEIARRAVSGMKGGRGLCGSLNQLACEFKFIAGNHFTAYAATFRAPSDEGDCVDDHIQPGAFAQDLSENGTDRPLFFQHDPDSVIGTAWAITEDRKGLKFHGRLDPENTLAMAIRDALEAKVLSEMSIGFKVLDCESKSARIVKRVKLYEISVVTAACDWRATTI